MYFYVSLYRNTKKKKIPSQSKYKQSSPPRKKNVAAVV